MRHGPAEAESPSGMDADRRLSPGGKEVVRRVAEELARRGETIERVLASPLVRAQETAAIVRAVLGVVAQIEVRMELAPSDDGVALAGELAEDGRAALVVSHAPDVSDVVSALTGTIASGFAAGMVVALEMNGRSATRRFSLDPAKSFQ